MVVKKIFSLGGVQLFGSENCDAIAILAKNGCMAEKKLRLTLIPLKGTERLRGRRTANNTGYFFNMSILVYPLSTITLRTV